MRNFLKLFVNGENLEFTEILTLEELINRLGIKKEALVAEVNRQVIHPKERSSLTLGEGDRVELIQFVGGG